jgi:uncharacterized membrane protein
MTQTILLIGFWLLAVGAGVVGGLFFAFSTFIMTALGRLPPAQGVAAMQSINVTILQSLFMPVFFGTTLLAAAVPVWALIRWGDAGAPAMLAGGVIYVVGMFVCTILFNVPLNNQLAAVDPASAEAAAVWARYLREWTLWNHVRTASCVVACALFIAAIAAR